VIGRCFVDNKKKESSDDNRSENNVSGQDGNEEKTKEDKLPDGYDSVYLHDPDSDNHLEGQYYHRYKIYNQDRVQLLHKVRTKILINEKLNQDKPECLIDGCEYDASTIYYCETDKAYFCSEHLKKHHSLEEEQMSNN